MSEQEINGPPAPKLLAVIMDRDGVKKLEDILREKRAHFHFMANGLGTASSDILKTFGLSGTEKTVCLVLEPANRIRKLMNSVVERLEFVRPGRGIAFTMPVSGMCAAVSHVFNQESSKEGWANGMEAETENNAREARWQLVVAVVNKGFSDVAMDAAKTVGARGGTIIHARRSGVEDAVKFFGISIQAEKEIVAIVVRGEQKKEMMQAINKECGVKTEAHGIVISLPVESCAGIGDMDEENL